MISIINTAIKKIQKKTGLNQGQIEKAVGFSQGHLSHLKNGTKNVNYSTIEKLLKFAELKIDVVDQDYRVIEFDSEGAPMNEYKASSFKDAKSLLDSFRFNGEIEENN